VDEIIIKDAELIHESAIVNLSRMYERELGWLPSEATRGFIKKNQIIVAIEKNYLQGFCEFGGLTKEYWTIYSLAVINKVQKKGIARKLINNLENKIMKSESKGIDLKVTLENYVAINFYERVGFKKIHLDPVGKNKQALWIMRKEIK